MNRGTTLSKHDGFGELISSTEILTTTWSWDTVPHGIGKLPMLESPDGQKTYSYNALGQLETLALAIDAESDVLQVGLDYDTFGRVATISYPTPAGAPLSGQGWNAYSYVANNPLSFVDPRGFEPDKPPIMNIRTEETPWDVTLVYPPRDGAVPPPPPPENEDTAEKVGAAMPPVDVGTTGNTATYDPQPVTTAPEHSKSPEERELDHGLFVGAGLGLLPFGGLVHQALDAANVLPRRTPEARLGMAIGQILGGLAAVVGGVTGDILGGIATTTGIGVRRPL